MVDRIPDLVRRLERVEDALSSLRGKLDKLSGALEERAEAAERASAEREHRLRMVGLAFGVTQVVIAAAALYGHL